MFESTSFPQAGDLFAGKYLIERIIGTGHMSVVFGARHHITGKSVAIRWLHPDPSAGDTTPTNGTHRAGHPQVIGHFQHRHILEVIDVDHASGSNYTVMEWPDGESLKARLARVGPLSVADAQRLLVPCMRGMNEAHLAGIEHLDLKPANILISPGSDFAEEVARVLDFEVADRWSTTSPPRPAQEIASPYYRAPEQLGELDVDHRADVYAFGAILYEALSGRPPFAPTPMGSQNYGIVSARSLNLSTTAQPLPPGADAIVGRAMSREPDARFQTLEELADAFDAYVVAPPGTFMTRTRQRAEDPRQSYASSYGPVPLESRRITDRPGRNSRSYLTVGLVVIALGALIGWYRASRRSDVIATYEFVAEPGVAVVELDEHPPGESPPAEGSASAERSAPPLPRTAHVPLEPTSEPGAGASSAPRPAVLGDGASPRIESGEVPTPMWRFPTPQLGAAPHLVTTPEPRAKPARRPVRASPARVAPAPAPRGIEPLPTRAPVSSPNRGASKDLPEMELM